MALLIRLLKLILKFLIYFAIFAAFVLLIPNLPPYTKFSKITIEPTQLRTGVLSPNGALNNAEKLFMNKLLGPEAFQIYKGELYTGLATGEVVKISPGGHITFVTKIGQPCTGLSQEHICGRPLGIEIDAENNQLYVADAYHGVWKVDLKTDKKQLLISPSADIAGRQPKLFNSISLEKNGDLYWTHSSSDYSLKDGAMTPLSDPSGRLLYYNSRTNQSNVLLDNLWFPNGVVVSPDKQFVLVSETNRYRIIKFYIDGPKKGKTEVFSAGLPGIPDNLRVLPDGSGILATLYVAFDDESPLISRTLADIPLARKFLARLTRLIEIPFEYLHEQYPHVILEEIIYKIGHFTSLSSILPQMSGILQINWNGEIVASYFNTDKSIGTASDAVVYNDKLYIGSPHSSYIASVEIPPLIKTAFNKNSATTNKAEVKKTEVKVESAATDKVKAEKKDVPNVGKPTTQKPPKPTSQSSEKKPNVGSHQKPIKESNKKENVDQSKPMEVKPVVTKPIKQETESKPKPVETKPIEKEGVTKPNTAKQETVAKSPQPVQEKLSKQDVDTKPKLVAPKIVGDKQQAIPTKTESVNVRKAEETPKIDPKTVDNKQKSGENSKVPDVKQNRVIPEAVKVKDPEFKVKTEKTPQNTEKSKTQKTNKNKDNLKSEAPNGSQKPMPDQIPVKEDIPSDRIKPTKETLKVIKKSGPVEIPNPN